MTTETLMIGFLALPSALMLLSHAVASKNGAWLDEADGDTVRPFWDLIRWTPHRNRA